MDKLSCLIVDDNKLARLAIAKCVDRNETLELAGECENAFDALKFVETTPVDLIFLDVEMPEMSGIEFINALTNVPQVVIVSGQENYAAEAFEYNVTDYIVKPVKYDRFLKAVKKVQEIQSNLRIDTNEEESIFFRVDGAYLRFKPSEINYIEALSDYAHIYTLNKRITVLSTMKSLQERLRPFGFFRCHRSYIANLKNLSRIEDGGIYFEDSFVPISRTFRQDLYKILNLKG